MYKELLEQMTKLAAECNTEELESRASQVISNLDALMKEAGYDGVSVIVPGEDGSLGTANLSDYMNDISDNGKANGIMIGTAGTLGAVGAGSLIVNRIKESREPSIGEIIGSKVKDLKTKFNANAKDATKDALNTASETLKNTKEAIPAETEKLVSKLKNSKLIKKASLDETLPMIDRLASAASYADAFDAFTKLAEVVDADELEVIANELLDKEAGFGSMVAGIRGGLQGAMEGAGAYNKAGKMISNARKANMIVKPGMGVNSMGMPIGSKNQYELASGLAGGNIRARRDAIVSSVNTREKGFFNNVKDGFQVGRENASDMYTTMKQKAHANVFDAQAGINNAQPNVGAAAPAANPAPNNANNANTGASDKDFNKGKRGPKGKSSEGTTNSQSNPMGAAQGFVQNMGQQIQNHPYLASAAALGAGMMIPRVANGLNYGMQAAQAPMAPMMQGSGYPPPMPMNYPYYR